MKSRMIASVLLLTLAAWLPAAARQNASPAPSDAGKAPPKAGCVCCDHMKDHGKEVTGDHGSKACCPAKEGQVAKSMPCCDGKEMAGSKKDGKDSQTAMNCCAGKEGKMCATKDAKDCCGKDAMACNRKDGKNCCAGHGHACSHGASPS
jgi:hypothetical protein